MNDTLVHAIIAILGTLSGGLVTFFTTYHLKKLEWKQTAATEEIERRERLYLDFIDESERLLSEKEEFDVDAVVRHAQIFALVGRIRIMASADVVDAAEKLVAYILKASKGEGSENAEDAQVSIEFSKTCREDLERMKAAS